MADGNRGEPTHRGDQPRIPPPASPALSDPASPSEPDTAAENAAEPPPSLGRSSSLIAVASLVSRVTGFLRLLALAAVLGFGLINSSYTVANTFSVAIYELLLGGVLSSVMVPVLVRAQKEDPDGGERFTRMLITMAGAALLVATALTIVAAPLVTQVYAGSSDRPEVATAFAVLLLPQIFFLGVGALLGAVLNSRSVFGPFAWAPVLNNVVVLATLGVYVLVPGEISVDPVRMGEPKLLVLGLGTTLGIVAQTVVLLPAMRRIGFRYRPVWGWTRRLTSAAGLAVWIVPYVLIGQVGLIVTSRVAFAADPGSFAIYSSAWLVFGLPYGVLGVSLLTALMPRMSRAAADGRTADVVADLSLGSRLSALALVPVSVLLTVFGTEVGIALFALRQANLDGATRLGTALAVSAFGLLPYAVTLLQGRVFYALTDSRTPTLIQLFIVAVKVPLLLVCPVFLAPEDVVLGLMAANSASFVFGAVLGNALLRRRLGPLDNRPVFGTVLRTTIASVVGGLLALGAVALLDLGPLVGWSPVGRAWTVLVVAVVVTGPVTLLAMRVLRVGELDPLWRRLARHRAKRRPPS